MKIGITTLALSVFCSVALSDSEPGLTFKFRGSPIKQLNKEELTKLVPAVNVTVFEPHENKEIPYRGVPFNSLLDAVYGPNWIKEQEILFTCVDGYQPAIEMEKFKKFQSILTFEKVGDPKFGFINQLHHNEIVELGPYYLVWDNLKVPELKKNSMDWPYQVVGVDLIRFSDRFPKTYPPEKSPVAAKRGFLAFKSHCMTCHSVNGEGGAKSIELNYPSSVTEYFKKSWLKKWILNPTSVRYNTTMPAMLLEDQKRNQIADDIISYLEVMAKNKKKP